MSTTLSAPYRLAAGDGIADLLWKGGRMTIKATAADTGGAFAQIETDDPGGIGTPLHVHRNEDESFYVLEGEVAVFVDDARIDLAAGDFAFAPRGVAHAYVVTSERARMLVTLSPAGLEELFVDLGTPVGAAAPDENVLPSMDELVRRFGAYGCDIVGPPPGV